MVTQTFHRNRFTWLSYILLAFYGYFLNILGPVTPFLKEEMRLSYTVSSFHFTAFAAGILLIGLGGHPLVKRVGRYSALWIGAAGLSLSVFVLLAGRSPVVTIGASFLMGLVGSLILVVVPSILSDQHRGQAAVAFSEANVVSSLVSTAAPLMVGWAVYFSGSWRLALGFAALTPILLRVGFRKTTPPELLSRRHNSGSSRQPLPLMYWVYWTTLALAVSVEFCMIFWSADFLEQGLGMVKVNAAQAVSLFLAAMIAGRLAGSRLVSHFSTRSVIIASILIAGVGFLLFWMTGQVVVGLVGLFVTGLGVANLYPLILSLAITTANDNTIQASTRATLASGTAILTLPLVLGRVADIVGIRPAFGVVTILLTTIFVIIVITGRNVPARQPI